jgi:hypothetical protein
VRTNLAAAHLKAAQLQAEACAPLERDYTWPATQPILDQHFGLASGAIILAVCGLEAAINEFHQDVIDGHSESIGRAAAIADQIIELWDTVDRAPLLRKYEWIVSLTRANALPRGADPYQSAADLIALRDALVHYKPEWYHDLKQSQTLEERLRTKFASNRLAAEGLPYLPYRACGNGSGLWGVKSAVALLAAFYAGLDVMPKKLVQLGAFLASRGAT